MGLLVGRGYRTDARRRQELREAELRRQEEERQIKRMVVGGPATEFLPAEPGLVVRQRELATAQREMARAQEDMAAALEALKQGMLEASELMAAHQREDVAIAEAIHEHVQATALHVHTS